MALSPFVKTLIAAGTTRASAATESFDLSSASRRGLILIHDVSAVAGAITATVSVLGVDAVSEHTWPILTGALQTGVSTSVLQVSPGMVAVANAVAESMLPAQIRVQIAYGDATSLTHSLSAQLID